MGTVLLVEDEPDIRHLLNVYLKTRGHQVSFASNGQEAWDMLASLRPDVILMDLNIPVMDGWTLTKQIKAHPTYGTIPVIAVTAHSLPSDRERAFAVGCDDYVSKPLDTEHLLALVQSYMDATPQRRPETHGTGLR